MTAKHEKMVTEKKYKKINAPIKYEQVCKKYMLNNAIVSNICENSQNPWWSENPELNEYKLKMFKYCKKLGYE